MLIVNKRITDGVRKNVITNLTRFEFTGDKQSRST